MTGPAILNKPPVVVFTDLDGTLLDHDSYAFDAAQPALALLAAHHIPVVPVTSKTLAELTPLMQAMQLSGAAIAENGAVIKRADGGIDCAMDIEHAHAALRALPSELREGVYCFSDMGVAEIAALTGLTQDAAALAAKRDATEPFLWRGADDAPPPALAAHFLAHGLELTRGGRFFHIVPPRDKAAAMGALLADYDAPPQSWALGDGPNDVAMLLAANRGALIANPHVDTKALLPDGHTLYLSKATGPSGWRDAIEVFLAQEFG